jgi:hypothetical protein
MAREKMSRNFKWSKDIMPKFGPSIVSSGLQLLLDADNPKSFPGKPTTNLSPEAEFGGRTTGVNYGASAWGGDSGTYSFSDFPCPETVSGGLTLLVDNTSDPAGSGGAYCDTNKWFSLVEGVTYTVSFWVYSDIVQSINGYMGSLNQQTTNSYKTVSSISAGPWWQKKSWSFTASAGDAANSWQFRHINYHNSKVYVTCMQVEAQTYVTPFVNGTRSAIGGWKDISGNGNHCDIDYMSFDGTGRLWYDGTGTGNGTADGGRVDFPNTACVTSNPAITQERTLSWWMKSYDTARRGLLVGSSTINHLEQYNSTSFRTEAKLQNGYSFGAGGMSIVAGTWTNITLVFDNSVPEVRWYQDGVLEYTKSMTNGTPANDYFEPYHIGRETGTATYVYAPSYKGYVDYFASYNVALTPAQVLQNYDALKGRFAA